MNSKPFWKAGGAFVVAFAAAMTATLDGRTDLGSMKTHDWVICAVGAAVTAGATFFVPYETTVKPG